MWVKRLAIGLAIAILLPCVVHYGVITFSPAAKYNDCKKAEYVKMRQAETADAPKASRPQVIELEQEYDAGEKRFNKHLFFVAVPAGILAVAVGFIMPVPGVGAGLMFGGLLTLVYGCFTYWSDLPVGVKFVFLLIGLIFLGAVGWLRLAKKERQ